jgi:hypothetical protein
MIYTILISSVAVNTFSGRVFVVIMLLYEEKNKNIMWFDILYAGT